MKKSTKRLISVFLSVLLLMSLCVSAFAAELNQDNATGDSTVYYKAGKIADPKTPDPIDDIMEGTYVVTIPEYIEAAPMDGTPVAQTVSATEVLLLPAETLSVSCSYSGELLLREDGTTKLGYEMQNNSTAFSSGEVVLSAAAGTPDATFSSEISSVLTANPIYAGVYTDAVTFTCSVA